MTDPDWRPALDVPGALSERECAVLHRLASRTTADRALEVGHFHGRSTVVLLTSLPPRCGLVTVDHHWGDQWSSPTNPNAVSEMLEPFAEGRAFRFVNSDMLEVRFADTDDDPDYIGPAWWPFGFVFYDANHKAEMVTAWWDKYRRFLAPDCTLVYDDGDWPEQATLGELAKADGFVNANKMDLYRHPDDDKRAAATYTLDVWRRDA